MGLRPSAPQRQSAWPPHIEKNVEPKPTPKAAANSNVLGVWENGVFRFNSPEAKEAWDRESYEQGVNTDTWSLGKEIDAHSAGLAQAGFAGTAMPGLYRGPDGKYRLMNLKTIESEAARDHRNRHLTGKTMAQLETATTMPGADEWVAQWKSAQASANDNGVTKSSAGQRVAAAETPDGDSQAAEPASKVIKVKAGGRGLMPGAWKAADPTNVRDLERIGTNSLLGDYGDEARAGLSAVGAWWDGRSFGEAYDSELEKERAETAAAQERQGLKGTAVEVGTSFIPFVGDASGAVADFKDWREHGDDWGWSDYGLVALGLVPGMPNRKATKGAVKIGEGLLDTATEVGDEVADLGKKASKADEAAEVAKVNYKALLEEAKSRVYLEGDARKLDRSTRGIIYVKEKAGGPEAAKEFMKTHPDVIYDAQNDMFHVSAICYDNPNPNGYPFIKLDTASIFGDNTELVLTDVKTKMAIWSEETQNKARGTLGRLQSALKQNPGIKVHYQFKTSKAAEAAQHFLEANDFADIVVVTVREQ